MSCWNLSVTFEEKKKVDIYLVDKLMVLTFNLNLKFDSMLKVRY